MLSKPSAWPSLIAGGAFTTFSALVLESSNFAGEGQWMKASANVLLNIVLGFLAFQAGFLAGSKL